MRSMIRVIAASASSPAPYFGSKLSESATHLLSTGSGISITAPIDCAANWISHARLTSYINEKAWAIVAPITTGP